jgi:hypothetical protein
MPSGISLDQASHRRNASVLALYPSTSGLWAQLTHALRTKRGGGVPCHEIEGRVEFENCQCVLIHE